ncbi:conserved hypothetical protein [Cupriavidus phytorum]|uniref:Transmembrane protein n=1 Tax=Cupriavidus taiwanensis TaxID=164546 RepID=A0A375CIR4_9BURK|nr:MULTISPECIES: hypothetical protein [Cupriavidus]SOY71785.1 conserved hypothetical protein [Cupriavidus taiwanensis]
MLERCLEYFLTEPRRLVNLGSALLQAGGLLLVAGLLGFLVTTAGSVVTGMATRTRPVVELAEVLPGLPTWWVPESLAGYGFAVCCGLIGLWAIQAGRTYQRLLGH